ncbi:MAG: collagen-like protein, partial [Bacteroidia bacterium]|nr:collagen-like protein [Bacteroidia bacterium]
MKKIPLLIIALFVSVLSFAQAPQKMSYQAVIRDASSNLVTSSPIGMQISILQGSPTGTPVYVETQTGSTNINGLVSLEIGTGTVISGNFSTISWAAGTYFIMTETDPTGGTSYTIAGTTQLMSVPYALYAETSGTGGPQGPTGATGPSGLDGTNGAVGATGPSGLDGTNGAVGATGPSGLDGINGAVG